MSDITIAGAYELKPGRFPDMDGRTIFRKVLEGALAEWPVRPQDIDGLMTTCIGDGHGYDTYAHDRLISDLNINATFAETINYGGGTHVGMVARAAQAIRAGQCNAVLCVSAGKFLKPGADGGRLSAKAISDPNLEVPYGTFIPALYALILSQFMHERNYTAEDIARVAVSARKWALINPDARQYGKGELTVEDVVNSRWICTPFHFLDCSFPSDGGGAVLVTRADLGRKWAKQPAYVKGYGEAHLRGTVSDPGNLVETGATVSGPMAFKQAGITPADIDVVQLYDAFSATPLLLLENLGFCKPGEAAAFVNSGALDPGGKLPANTGGGLLSFAHTGESSGMTLLTEGAKQAMGLAGERQVPNVKYSLIHAYGGMTYDHGTLILGSEA